ncbi:MAG: low molecular weight protein-tyrosine-phosphatase [Alistipes sp.]
MKIKILFVCLGNICRSPAAESILRKAVENSDLRGLIETDSAGTYGGHAGQPSDERMRRAAARRGYAMTHLARQIHSEDFEMFDLIVVMDDNNYEQVHRSAPSRALAQKIFRMAEFCHTSDCTYIPDPYYEGHAGFERVLDLLEDGCDGILQYLKNQSRS